MNKKIDAYTCYFDKHTKFSIDISFSCKMHAQNKNDQLVPAQFIIFQNVCVQPKYQNKL